MEEYLFLNTHRFLQNIEKYSALVSQHADTRVDLISSLVHKRENTALARWIDPFDGSEKDAALALWS